MDGSDESLGEPTDIADSFDRSDGVPGTVLVPEGDGDSSPPVDVVEAAESVAELDEVSVLALWLERVVA